MQYLWMVPTFLFAAMVLMVLASTTLAKTIWDTLRCPEVAAVVFAVVIVAIVLQSQGLL